MRRRGYSRARFATIIQCRFFAHKKLIGWRGKVPEEEYTLPLDEAAVKQEGGDVTVVATQLMYHRAKGAVKEFDGTSVEMISPRTFAPLDMDTIADSVAKTGRLVVVDETPLRYETQSHIVSEVTTNNFFSLNAPPQTVGVKDTPIPFSPPLEDEVLPSTDRIIDAIQATF